MLKKNLSLGLVTLLSVVASGLFASCGEDADGTDKDNTEVITGDPSSTATDPTPPATTPSSTTATTASSTVATTASTPAAATSSAPAVEPPVEPTGDATAGADVYSSNGCATCHGATGAGDALGPNISGSMTAGIGDWSFTDLQTGLRTGTDPEGVKFCTLMVAFPETMINDQQVADLLAFLKSSSSDEVKTGACP